MARAEKNADVTYRYGLAVGIDQKRRIGKLVCFPPVTEVVLEMGEFQEVARLALELARGKRCFRFKLFHLVLTKQRMKKLDVKFEIIRLAFQKFAYFLFCIADIAGADIERNFGLRVEAVLCNLPRELLQNCTQKH